VPVLLGILVSAVVIFAVFAVTMGRGGSMTYFRPDWPGQPLPEDRTVRAADIAAARFSLAFRGYRMAEVDDALDRLAGEIAERDAAIEQLTGRPFELQLQPIAESAEPVESTNRVELGKAAAPTETMPVSTYEPPAPYEPPPSYERPPADSADSANAADSADSANAADSADSATDH
jgi:DivIVA domain-containing protein